MINLMVMKMPSKNCGNIKTLRTTHYALRLLLATLLLTSLISIGFEKTLAQAPEVASYQLDVQLDPQTKTITGQGRITYTNPSQDTLAELWLHLYLKAFSSFDTLWMRESGGEHRLQPIDPTALGDITLEKLTLPDGTDLLSRATFTDTLVQLPLAQTLGPGESIELDMAWSSKLPRVFARTGYGGRDDTFFMVGQWYPKMAVYFDGQWDTLPWHTNSEFFHDFGNYEVNITLPHKYVVAGVGLPSGEIDAGNGLKTVRYTASNVTDFAFAASPDFQIETAQAGDTEVLLYYLPQHTHLVSDYLDTAVNVLQKYGDWYGPYPHPRLTVVDVPNNASGAGGMEYPTLITGGSIGMPGEWGYVALVTAHEIAHEWWPMQTATHEGREPWLDESLAEYSTLRYMAAAERKLGLGPLSLKADTQDRIGYALFSDRPGDLPAWAYGEFDYAGIVYNKNPLGLWTLENVVGSQRFRQAMSNYLTDWRFKHPTGADFRASLEQSLAGDDLGWFFDEFIATSGVIDYAVGPIENQATVSNVEIRREGSVRPPVEVRITFADGTQETITWDGQAESTVLTFPEYGAIVRVEIDPERKLMAELDITDNSAGSLIQPGPTVIVSGRLLFWLQMFISFLGLIG